MRYGILRFLALLFIALLPVVACGAGLPVRYLNPQHASPTFVAVWLDPKAGLPPEDTLTGCNYWNELDVRCVMTPNLVEADVVIVADTHPCSPNGKGSFELAFASPARVISVRLDCFYDTSRTSGLDREQYRSVIAHEIGHELGIWDHVPLQCNDAAEKAKPEAARRCGRAIMNPSYDSQVQYLTPADAVAFEQRDLEHTVVPRHTDNDERRLCVFTASKK